MRRDANIAVVLAGCACVILLIGVIKSFQEDHHAKCNHGESSIAGHFARMHGKRVFVIDQPATKTGC